MNVPNRVNGAPSNKRVTKNVQRMRAESIENPIGIVVWKDKYCVFAPLNSSTSSLGTDSAKPVRPNGVNSERRRKSGNLFTEAIAVRNAETASWISIGIRIRGTAPCIR